MKISLLAPLLLLLVACTSCSDTTGLRDDLGTGIDYPVRAVNVIIPFGRGSASDVFVREFSLLLEDHLQVAVEPQNKKGSGGLIGLQHAANKPADGYTILEITPSHVIADVLQRTAQVSLLNDFQPLALIQKDHYLLLAPNRQGCFDLASFLAAKPERVITVAGISPLGLDEITLAELARVTGKQLRFVPYKSGAAIRAALRSGEVDLYLGKSLSTIKHIRSGKMKPLMVLNEQRLTHADELARIPCTQELGFLVTIKSWRGFVVRKEVSRHIRDYLVDQLRRTYNSEAYQIFSARHLANYETDFLPADMFGQFLQAQYDYFQTVIKRSTAFSSPDKR